MFEVHEVVGLFFMPNKTRDNAVKVKIVRENGKHCVKEVCREGWRTLSEHDKKDKALAVIEKHYADKDARYALEVKARARHTCEGFCGEMNRELLEVNHKQPKYKRPDLAYDIENGEYVCIWLHAFRHKNELVIMNIILLRLVRILTKRYCKPFSKCQTALFEGLK